MQTLHKNHSNDITTLNSTTHSQKLPKTPSASITHDKVFPNSTLNATLDEHFSPWFGSYSVYDDWPWLYHDTYKWMKLAGKQPNENSGVWLYSSEYEDWWYTKSSWHSTKPNGQHIYYSMNHRGYFHFVKKSERRMQTVAVRELEFREHLELSSLLEA